MTEILREAGIRELTQPGYEMRTGPRITPWGFDNGQFRKFQDGQPFDEAEWLDTCDLVATKPAPDFGLVPDLVGDPRSLAFSAKWIGPSAAKVKTDWYLAVQEGMAVEDVDAAIRSDGFRGVFVGGASLLWKYQTTPTWLELARSHGVPCHVGRIGIPKRIRWARRVGVDSIDSSQGLWTYPRVQQLIAAWRDDVAQEELFS